MHPRLLIILSILALWLPASFSIAGTGDILGLQVRTATGTKPLTITAPTAGQVLKFSGTPATPLSVGTLSTADITGLQAALDLKAPIASPTFTGTVSGITKSMVGLGNVDNTSDENKPVSTAQQATLDLKAPLASPTFTGVTTITGGNMTFTGDGSLSFTNAGQEFYFEGTSQASFRSAIGLGNAATLTVDADLATLSLPASTTISAFVATLTDDADAATARTTLGLGTLATQSGTFSGTNTGDETLATIKSKLGITTLSGANTGDQTITLTGNVTGGGTGSFATTIAAGAVTNAMLAGSIASSKLVGTDITTVGTLAAGAVPTTLLTGTITNAQLAGSIDLTTKVTGALPQANIAALTGDVTKPSGSGVTTIASLPAISGANLTTLNATNLASGTVADARLSANVPLLNAANTFSNTTGNTFSSSPIIISGNISAPAWTTNGIRIKGTPGTLTDTTSTGTVATAYTDVLGGNTIAASAATTFTNYVTNYTKDPIAGANVTMTNKWALGADSARFGTSNQATISNAGVLTLTGAAVLGTPASINLTNATALPVSGITASTTTALGVGSIELGHATDTTIARVSAGVFSVEGATVPTISSISTLTNKSLSDSTCYIVDVADATKRINFDVTGTTGITGVLQTAFTTAKTITFPDVTDTVVTLAATQSLSNKTFAGATYFGTVYGVGFVGSYHNGSGTYVGVNAGSSTAKVYTSTSVDINISPNDTAALVIKSTNQVVETKGGVIKKITADISTSLTLTSVHHVVTLNNGSAVTLNLPAGVGGTEYIIKNKGAGTVTITPNGTQKLFTTAQVATLARTTGQGCIIIFDGTDWSVVSDY